MSIDFDTIIPREGTDSVKWDGRQGVFNSEDLIPMWVADMDFAVPEAISRALVARAEHPVFGYTLVADSVYEALIHWMRQRHGFEVQRDWIILSPGVVPTLHASALAFAQAGEGVIVQPPVYFPFFSAVTETGRKLILNPLKLDSGRYTIDFDHLEQCAGQGAKLLMLCSPHNPVGRVWSEDELLKILEIARRHDLIILSDEIHHDLIFPEARHIPLQVLAGDAANIVTAVAPSKTFNIPGLGLSALIVPNPKHRTALRKAFELLHTGASNPFSLVAFEAAYREGEEWLEALLVYLTETRDFVAQYLARHIPKIKLIQPEGTYLLWLDCRELGMSDSELRQFFIHQAKVGMNPGTVFGEGGSGFMRMNIGTSRLVVKEALERIQKALK
jgi:cystathionine beta-lyase